MKNHYQTLGVESDAGQSEIKAAYRKLALKYHPDRNLGDSGAASQFTEIQEAYKILSNPQKKQIFDKLLTIHLEDKTGDSSTEDDNLYEKKEFSWNILFAAVFIVVATIFSIKYYV